jgi:hypothetical protein
MAGGRLRWPTVIRCRAKLKQMMRRMANARNRNLRARKAAAGKLREWVVREYKNGFGRKKGFGWGRKRLEESRALGQQ